MEEFNDLMTWVSWTRRRRRYIVLVSTRVVKLLYNVLCQALPPEEEKELKETLQDIIGHRKKVKLEQKIDPSILGGLVVEFSQKVFDMSIRTRARQMERFLRDPINIGNL